MLFIAAKPLVSAITVAAVLRATPGIVISFLWIRSKLCVRIILDVDNFFIPLKRFN